MKLALPSVGLAAFLMVGCQGNDAAFAGSPVSPAISRSKNPSSDDSPTVQRHRKWHRSFYQAKSLAEKGTREEGKAAEAKLRELMLEDPSADWPYLVLAQMYQRHGEIPRAADMYRQYLDHNERYVPSSIHPQEWYWMYTAFKEVGQEQDARKALIKAIERQNVDPSVSYTDPSKAPPLAAVRMGEYLVARSLMSGADKGDFAKGIEGFVALADKEGMTPKMLMKVAGLMRHGNYRDKRIELYKQIAQTNSPEAAKARKELTIYGVIKDNTVIGPGVPVPPTPPGVRPAKGWQH